jgi:hypothetical protein
VKIKILALCGPPDEENGVADGYMDDGSESYKRFRIENDEFYIIGEYPKDKYKDEYMFREIMAKFDPYTFFMRQAVEVDKIDIDTLHDIYWDNYER